MSKTPRTDAKERETDRPAHTLRSLTRHAHYGWKFARTLEIELAEAREDLQIHEGINVERDASLVGAQERIRNLEMDLAEKVRPLDAEMARLNANLIAANIEIDRLRAEGATLREQLRDSRRAHDDLIRRTQMDTGL